MGIYMWEKVKKVVPFNVPGLQDPRRELSEGTNLGHFRANFSYCIAPKWPKMAPKGYPEYTRVIYWVTAQDLGPLGPV